MEKANPEAKPFVELFYWFVWFFLLGLFTTFRTHHHPPVDYDAMDTNAKIGRAIGGGVFAAFFIWMLNSLRRWLFRKIF